MFRSAEIFQDVLTKLSVLRYLIASNCKRGKLDITIDAENFYAKIINKTHNMSLINLNNIVRNHPAIDLGDLDNKVGIQVTADSSSEKIHQTIATFIEHRLYEKYTRLIIFILTSKKDYKAKFLTQDLFVFNPERDIWDLDDLMMILEQREHETREIELFIREELPAIVSILTPPESILARIEADLSKPAKNSSNFLQFCGFTENSKEWIHTKNGVDKLFALLKKESDRSMRELLSKMIELSTFVDEKWEHSIFVFHDVFCRRIRFHELAFTKYYNQLQYFGLASYEEDFPHRLFLHFGVKETDSNLFFFIKKYFENDSKSLTKLFTEIDFSLLD